MSDIVSRVYKPNPAKCCWTCRTHSLRMFDLLEVDKWLTGEATHSVSAT